MTAPKKHAPIDARFLAKVSGITGIICILSLALVPLVLNLSVGGVAIVTGHIARSRISKNKESKKGSITALVGLILGYFTIFLTTLEWSGRDKVLVRAKTVTSLAQATALETAVTNFYHEYSTLPDVGNRVTTDTDGGTKLLNTLLGLEAKSTAQQNLRDIKFLSVKEGKNRKNGLIYSESSNSVEGLFDSWGSPFTVILDTDYDETLRFKIEAERIDLKGIRAAAFSPGPDQKLGTEDDIRTW